MFTGGGVQSSEVVVTHVPSVHFQKNVWTDNAEKSEAEENAQLVSPSMQRAFDYMSKGMLRIRDNRIAMFRAMHPPAEKTEE